MSNIKLFESKHIRSTWDDAVQRWFFAVVDVVAALTESQRFERDYLLAVIDKNLFWLTTAGWPYKNPFYYGRDLDPEVYVTREYAPLAVRMKAYIAYARAIPGAIEQIRGNLRPPLPRTYIDNGRVIFGGLASFYATAVPVIFAAVLDEKLQEELRRANAVALRAVQEMDTWLAAQQESATEDFALGAELFEEMLRRTERIDLPLARLETLGRQDLARNLVSLREACAFFLPDATLAACVDAVNANKPAGGAVAGARRQLDVAAVRTAAAQPAAPVAACARRSLSAARPRTQAWL